MARSSPAVERAVAVLNHLAAHPTEQFSLSELARVLDLNKATAHALLATLVAAGYVVRAPEAKTYGMGPALIALGSAAMDSHPAVSAALPEMRELSEAFDVECVASAAIQDEIVILARAGIHRPLGIAIQPGQRIPLVPPLGVAFVAWEDPARIEHWLARLGPHTSREKVDRYRAAVDRVRERGYSIGLEGEAQQRFVEQLRDSGGPGDEEDPDYAIVEFDHWAAYRLAQIGAPVFDADGRVVIALFLIGFRDQIAADEVPRYAERLRAATTRITKAIGGRPPEDVLA